ncbi:hypothetical protein VNO78_08304 [Psophocarpus tetragonolobus]|uniref:Uncharacterized protein n=1 Tax=Psophocarpus tetragonolobus TaxID=3891 RepID=A0AAN9XSR9_PSOTE
MWKSLYDFPQSFVSSNLSVNVSLTYDDEDLSDDLIQFAKQSCSASNLALFYALVLLQRILPCMVQLKENLEALVNEGCQFLPQLLYCRRTELLFGFPQWTTRSSLSCTEIGAEISLAKYEALISILRVLASTYFAHSCCLVEESEQLFPETEGRSHLDYMGVYFIQNINDVLGFGVLVRTQRAVLLDIATIFLFVMRHISLLPYYLIFGL